MKRRLIALSATLSASLALAVSPAQSAYDQAARLLTERYGGLSTVDRRALVRDGQTELDAACAPQGENCAFDVAYRIISKQVSALNDGHSNFYSPEAYERYRTRASGGSTLQYGVSLRNLDGGEQVVYEVVPGSAAEEAGLRRGDRLVTIDGQKYTFDLLRASTPKGVPITLGVVRGGQTLSVVMTARVSTTRNLPRVEYVNDVAVLRIPTFQAGGGVAQTVHDLVREAKNRAARAIIVDLRDNPGGLLNECDQSISAFVPRFERVAKTANGDVSTVVTTTSYRQGGTRLPTVANANRWDGPMAVLVNSGSGSCSEFFAREIQYANRGSIIGETTAGVGNTATLIYALPGGAGMQLSSVYYAKPDGSPYPDRVQPDIAFKDDFEQLSRGVDVMLQKGIESVRMTAGKN